MIGDSKKQAYHLDDLRMNKNFTVEDLCDGICTDRQYRRYVSGYSVLPFTKLKHFCNKLNISISDFFYSLSEKDRMVYSSIADIYSKIISGDIKTAKYDYEHFKYKNTLEEQNERFFYYIGIRINYDYEQTNDITTLYLLKKHCNYQKTSKNNAFDFVDILYLHLISQIEIKSKTTNAMEVLEKILNSDEKIYISSENKHIFPPIYANLSIILGKLGKIMDSLKMSQNGIKFCIHHQIFKSLSSLYYTEMYSHHLLGNAEKSYSSAIKCISSCISSENHKDLVFYIDLIEKDLGVNPITLFSHIENSMKNGILF